MRIKETFLIISKKLVLKDLKFKSICYEEKIKFFHLNFLKFF